MTLQPRFEAQFNHRRPAMPLAPVGLLVDYETGRVLRADDQATITQRVLDSHPFIESCGGVDEPIVVFAGPDARRAVDARRRGEPTTFHRVTEYEVHGELGGLLTLQKVEYS